MICSRVIYLHVYKVVVRSTSVRAAAQHESTNKPGSVRLICHSLCHLRCHASLFLLVDNRQLRLLISLPMSTLRTRIYTPGHHREAEIPPQMRAQRQQTSHSLHPSFERSALVLLSSAAGNACAAPYLTPGCTLMKTPSAQSILLRQVHNHSIRKGLIVVGICGRTHRFQCMRLFGRFRSKYSSTKP